MQRKDKKDKKKKWFSGLFKSSAEKSGGLSELPPDINIKLVVVGDFMTRKKTALLDCYVTQEVERVYIPTVFDNHTVPVQILGGKVELGLWDTTGQEDAERLRPLSYPDANIIMLTYDVSDPASLQHMNTWIQEVKHYAPHATLMLVGIADTNSMGLANDEKMHAAIKKLCAEHEIATAVTCNLSDINSVNRTFDHAVVDRLAVMKSTKQFIKDHSAEINMMFHPEKEKFLKLVSMMVSANKKNPDSQFYRVPKDVLILLIEQTARELKLPFNRDVVEQFIKIHNEGGINKERHTPDGNGSSLNKKGR